MNSNYIFFNEKRIYYTKVENQIFVAIKPICEALNINYHRQRENLLNDPELGQLRADQRVVAADGKNRIMVCLPEKFIYGWIFSLRSESDILKIYRLKCYEILYNHFEGVLSDITSLLSEKKKDYLEENKILDRLKTNEDFIKLQEIKKNRKSQSLKIANIHKKLSDGPTLFNLDNY